MIKLAFAAALFAAPVRAQVAADQPWVKPIADAVFASGSDRVGGLGIRSLSVLSTLDASGRLPFAVEPGLLSPLAKAVEEQGLDPEAFSALPADARLSALSKAASAAERAAADAAAQVSAAVARPIRVGTRADVSDKIARAEKLSFYLSAEQAEALASAKRTLAVFDLERAELIRRFERDLPGKIAAAGIGADELIRRDEDGWHALDEHPDRIHPTLSHLYAARLDHLDGAPLGPWTLRETALIRSTLDASTGRTLTEENERSGARLDLPPSARSFNSPDGWLEFIGRKLDFADRRAREEMGSPRMKAAVARFQKGNPRPDDFPLIERLYRTALSAKKSTTRAWIIGTIRSGFDGLPGWNDFKTAHRAIQARDDRRVGIGFLAQILGVAAGFLAPDPWKPLAIVAILLAMGWVGFYAWRANRSNFDEQAIDRQVEASHEGR